VVGESQTNAIANLARGIDLDARLPHRVFTEKHAEVYVTDWRALIHRSAVKISKVLMEHEGSSVVVLGRFDRPHLLSYCSFRWKFSWPICRIPVRPFDDMVKAGQPARRQTVTR
jgi:hypothetical protein